jgi:hypothetical protein
MIGRTPCSRAATENRCAPYTPLRSSNAIAGISSFAATSANCSGKDPPRKKLNALQQCNSQ